MATWRLPTSTSEYANKKYSNTTWKSKLSSRCEYVLGKTRVRSGTALSPPHAAWGGELPGPRTMKGRVSSFTSADGTCCHPQLTSSSPDLFLCDFRVSFSAFTVLIFETKSAETLTFKSYSELQPISRHNIRIRGHWPLFGYQEMRANTCLSISLHLLQL